MSEDKSQLHPGKNVSRSTSLAAQIVDILTDRIKTGAYPAEGLLPAENELASEFKVSRTTIRSAFDRLEAAGLIERRHGIGTFVHRLPPAVAHPLNRFFDLRDLIAISGAEPGFRQLSADFVEYVPETTEALHLEVGEPMLMVEKLFLADGEPAVYCIDYFPWWVFEKAYDDPEVEQDGITEPLFDFLEDRCGFEIGYYVASLRSDILRNCPRPETFSPMSGDTPVLIVENVGYTADARPVHQRTEYFPGNRFKLQVMRSR